MREPFVTGCPSPGLSCAGRLRLCVSVIRIKMKRWSQSIKRWTNAAQSTRSFMRPKTGADWELRGHQKRVVTPGQNEKYYLAGALHSGTGKVSYVGGGSKSSVPLISLLKYRKAAYRRAKTITLIVDNYIIYKSQENQSLQKANPKFRGIYQPVYSPWVNHVERLWQVQQDTIIRNHQCRTMWQLLRKVHHFMETVSPFPGAKHGQEKV